MKRRGFFMKSAAKEAEILIYEEIGESWWSGSGISAKRFAEDLKALGDGIETLNVRINSPGGDVFDGAAIKTQLEQHPATVNVFIDGLAASAASYIAMAGKTIQISDNALFMIHNAQGGVLGNAADMRQMADLLDKIDSTIAAMYTRRTKQPDAKIKDWMAAETWFNAEEAVKYGFADAIMPAVNAEEPAAMFDLSRFKNAPRVKPAMFDERTFLAEQDIRRRRVELAKLLT
jgi:ATP-dependent protease ClpP protease subunit